MPSIYLIRIAVREERVKAMKVFLMVGDQWVSMPGNVMGITKPMACALEKAGVLFEYLSKEREERKNGKNSAVGSQS